MSLPTFRTVAVFAAAAFCGWVWWTILAAIATVGVDR